MKEATKHTPGPWTATHSVPSDGYDCWWITANPGSNREKELATVSGGAPSSEANAHLIASAPDLAEALEVFARIPIERATSRAEQNDPWPDDKTLFGYTLTVGDVRRARSALARARGETE